MRRRDRPRSTTATSSPASLPPSRQAAASAAAPDPHAHLPAFAVKAVVPFAAGDGSWLRDGIRQVGRTDAVLGAELLLALTPMQAHAARRPVAYQLTVNDAGTWRVELGDLSSAIAAGASDSKVAFRVSGTAGELAALFAGGGRRKLAAHIEGSRMALWRLSRARRTPPTLAQAVAAGGDFSLQAMLALLGAVATEGGRTVVAFDDGDRPITAVATRRGAVVLRSGIEQPQATLHALRAGPRGAAGRARSGGADPGLRRHGASRRVRHAAASRAGPGLNPAKSGTAARDPARPSGAAPRISCS